MKSSATRPFRGTPAAALSAFVLLVVVAFAVDRSTNLIVEEATSVRHTYEVILRLDLLEDALGDAENARRGYALTGDASYANAFDEARARIDRLRSEIRAQTSDNGEQQRRLDRIDAMLNERIAMLDAAMHARGAAIDIEREGRATKAGAPLAASIRASLAEMTNEERRLLDERRAAGNRALVYLRWTQLGGVATAIVLLSWAIARLRREGRDRARSEVALAITLNSIADGVVATDNEGNVTRMNRVAEALTGWKADDARGRPASKVVDLRHGGEVLVAKNGDETPVLESKAPITGDDGVAMGTVVVLHDATAQRAAEVERTRLTAFLDSIIESVPDMIFVKDAKELRFERLNRAGEELLGMKREAMLGKNDYDFFPEEQARAFTSADRAVLEKGDVVDIAEEPIETKRGRRWLHTKKVPIVAPDGTPLHLLGVSEDITERKAAAEELRSARDNLEAANKELEAFSYSVAHDLRAPLRAIDGFSAALLEDHAASLDDTGKDYLQRVSKGARRMGELIDDLLQLSRLMRAETRMQAVDLSAMGTAVAADLRERHPRGEVRVQPNLTAHGDPGFLRVALENLIDNALKFSSKNDAPLVELGTTQADGQDVFFVRDNGVGFDVSAAKNLFGAFQRFHKPTEFRGTGIGLATVQRVVRRHGGRIWAESEPGRGTTFFFTLTPEART